MISRTSSRESEYLIDDLVREVSHGRFERSLSGLTAVSALVTGVEVYLEHYKGSFGNKWMSSPVLLTPPLVVAGIGGVFSRRWAKTALPVTAGLYTANGLLGEYFHARGGPQTRRVAVVVVQPADGSPDLRAGADVHGRRDGAARRGPAPREVGGHRCPTRPVPTTFPIAAPTDSHRIPHGCPGSAAAQPRR